MSHSNDPRLEPALEHALGAAPAPRPSGKHPDFVTLAQYLEGDLEGGEREALEGHLAACDGCRELAMEAALANHSAARPRDVESEALDLPPVIKAARLLPFPRRAWRPALAAAAVLVLVAFTALWTRDRGPSEAVLSDLGLPRQDRARLPASLLAATGQALEGNWPRLAELEDLGAWEEPALRAGVARPPVGLAPRWSRISELRPSFSWHCGNLTCDGRLGEDIAAEITVIDKDEAIVAILPWQGPAAVLTELPWPAELPSLVPGHLYAWRASLRLDGEWQTSSFIPFHIRTPEEKAELELRLDGVSSIPALRAVLLSSAGSHELALEALTEAPATDATAKLARSILTRRRLPEDLHEGLLRPWRHVGTGS